MLYFTREVNITTFTNIAVNLVESNIKKHSRMFFEHGLLLNVWKSCCLFKHAQLYNRRPIHNKPSCTDLTVTSSDWWIHEFIYQYKSEEYLPAWRFHHSQTACRWRGVKWTTFNSLYIYSTWVWERRNLLVWKWICPLPGNLASTLSVSIWHRTRADDHSYLFLIIKRCHVWVFGLVIYHILCFTLSLCSFPDIILFTCLFCFSVYLFQLVCCCHASPAFLFCIFTSVLMLLWFAPVCFFLPCILTFGNCLDVGHQLYINQVYSGLWL